MHKIEQPEGSIRVSHEIDVCPICSSGKPVMHASGAYQCPRCSYGSGIAGYTLIAELTLYPMYTEDREDCFSCHKDNQACLVVWRQISWEPRGQIGVNHDIDRDPNGSDFTTSIREGMCCGECAAIATMEYHPSRRIPKEQARALLDAGYLPRFPHRAAS